MADGLDVLLGTPVAPAQQASAAQTGLDVLLAPPGTLSASIPAPNAPQSVGVLGNVSGAVSALGHHLMNMPHGLAQLIENGIAKGSEYVSNKVGSPDNVVNSYIQRTVAQDNDAMKQREANYQAAVPDSPGAYTGAAIGEVAPWIYGGGLQLLTKGAGGTTAAMASQIPLVGGSKVVQALANGAGQGAVMSAAAPVTGDGDYWDEKGHQIKVGAAVGGAVSGGAQGLVTALNAAKNAATPVLMPGVAAGKAIGRAAGADPQALAQALKGPQELVPNSLPTTAQMAGTPEMVQLEKALGNTPKGKLLLEARQLDNNKARLAAVESVAGSDGELLAAKQARSAATAEWTNPETGKLVSGTPVDAAPIIEQLQALRSSSLGVKPTIGRAADDIISTIRERAATDPQSGAMMVPPGILDAVRQNVKAFLAQHATHGVVGSKEGVAFEPVRNSIVGAIEGANPGYRDYLATYAKYSEPIRAMEAGRKILDGLSGGRDSVGNPVLSLRQYNSLLAQALKGEYAVAPDALAKLNAVQADLQRASISNSLKQPGSDTLYNANADGLLNKALYGNDFKGGLLPKATGAAVGAALGGVIGHGTGAAAGAAGGAAAAAKLTSLAGERYTDALADALLNPLSAENALTKLGKSAAPKALAKALRAVPLLSAVRNQ